MTTTLTIRRPDDWHLHLRDGAMLAGVLPASRHFARAIVMPNLVPPVVTAAEARAYRDRIVAALPEGQDFAPLMTLYLTDGTRPDDVAAAAADGLVTAVKLYPAGATTNSDRGVHSMRHVMPVLERMAEIGLPLCVHGEVTDAEVDIFDREAAFIDRVLAPLRERAARAQDRPRARHDDRGRALRRGVAQPRGDAHRAPPDPEPEPHAGRRHPAALLLPAGGQAREASAGAAAGGDGRRPALLPRHRQRAAREGRQGGRLRLRRRLHRPGGARLPRACLRGGGRARAARGVREPQRPGVLPARRRTRRA